MALSGSLAVLQAGTVQQLNAVEAVEQAAGQVEVAVDKTGEQHLSAAINTALPLQWCIFL